MYTLAKRRVREAERRMERVEFKFITEYVKALHGDIYEKAKELYENTRQKYPDGVKDLTKTYEFMSVATPGKHVPRYYMSRRTKETTIMSKQMVLEIPLMLPQAVAVSSPRTTVSSPPQASPHPLPPTTLSSPHPVPPLSEEVYYELLQDIQHDPDLARILNDFPLHDEDECMRDNIWDSIQTQEISPLEQELSNIL